MKKMLNFRLCLMCLLALSAYSCRTDYLPEKETFSNNSAKFQLNSKRISLNEAKHKSVLLPKIEKAELALRNSKTNVKGRIINYGNGVSIDTDEVIYIENGPNYHTYTFHINRENAPDDAPLENLVLSPMSDGSYKELLVSYNLTPQEKQTLRDGGFVDTKGKTDAVELIKGTFGSNGLVNKATCGYVEEVRWTRCSEDKHGESDFWNCTFWANPNKGIPPMPYTVLLYRCDFLPVVDTDLGSSGGNTPPTPPLSGGGEGNNNNNPPPCDDPILQNPQDIDFNTGTNSCGNGVVTMPLPDRRTPCEKVKTQFANENYKNKVASINKNAYFKLKEETGFKENKDGTFVDLQPSGGDALTIVYNAQTKGYTHVHVNDQSKGVTPQGYEVISKKIRMFSPADVNVLMGMADFNKSPENFGDLYGTMLSSDGTYVIKFTGTAADIKMGFGTTEWRKKFEKYFEENIEFSDNTTLFLKFLKDKMQINGISLFNVKNNGNVYAIKLNAAGTKAVSEKCSD